MILAVDVHYDNDASAIVGAVLFSQFSDSMVSRKYTKAVPVSREYIPGWFYLRELPCILAMLKEITEQIDTVIIDGYVEMGGRKGLGLHLWEALDKRVMVIGVAKKRFRGAKPVELYRQSSRHPLYITSAGIEQELAARHISCMQGKYRMPDLLKLADTMSRSPELTNQVADLIKGQC